MQSVSAVALLVVLALYGASEVEGGKEFWGKYGAIKIMERCLTEQGTHDWIEQLQRAIAVCNDPPAEGATEAALVLPKAVDWSKLFAQFYSQNYRTKRGATFTAQKIDQLKQKLIKKIKTFRCVMKEVRVTDSSNEVSVEKVLEQYRALSIPQGLYRDIEQAVQQCKQFSQCLPLTGRNDLPVPADVLRTKAFIKCEKNFRLMACLKEDLKPIVGSFELAGLDGTLDFLDSDPAKAVAVLLANDKVGNEDYGLFE